MNLEMNFCGTNSPVIEDGRSVRSMLSLRSPANYDEQSVDNDHRGLPYNSVLSPGSFASEDESIESPRRKFVNIKGLANSYSSVESSSNFFIPEYGSEAIEKLAIRLEEGFRAKLHDGRVEDAFLHLSSDRTSLCIQRNEDEKKDDLEESLHTLRLDKILRLEVGKSGTDLDPSKCFTIIYNAASEFMYYDFEAYTPIDREILVSTLMVVLEQAHSQVEKAKELYNSSLPFGSLNQPILCSPSLENEDGTKLLRLSPKRRTQIYESESALESTETSLAKETGIIMVTSTDEENFDEKAISRDPSQSQLVNHWCSDDVCSSALKDIADKCSSIFAIRQIEGTKCMQSDEQILLVEDYFTAVLGAPSAMLTYVTGDVWEASEVLPTVEHNKIQNRATRLNAQATRLEALREEMTFAMAIKESKRRILRSTQSFDNYENIQAADLSKRLFKSPLLRNAVGSMSVPIDDNDDVAYYDSDPEDIRPRTMHRGPRHVRFPSDSTLSVASKTQGSKVFQNVRTNQKRVSGKLGDEAIIEMVQAMTNESLALKFHPPAGTPIMSKTWIENGISLIDGSFVLPKLCWSPYTTSRSSEYIERMTKIDLLDICRVRPLESRIEQALFADPKRSFVIQTNERSYVMEAESEEERDRIVYGLKLVIARLASLLMLKDQRAVEEFFGTILQGAPGEAPAMLNEKPNT